MLNDLKYAFRVIAKYPISNTVIVFTIASLVAVIGLIYHSVDASFGKKMPFEDPDRLVRLWRVNQSSRTSDRLPAQIFAELRTNSTSFAGVGAFVPNRRHTLTGVGEVVTLNAVTTTSEVLDLTGHKPLRGRFFSRTDEQVENRNVIVIAERIWRKYLDSNPDILGQEIELNEEPYVVVGIAPDALYSTHLVYAADIWMPFDWAKDGNPKKSINVVARIKPDASLSSAQSELKVVAAQLAERYPIYELRNFRLAALDQQLNRSWSLEADQVFLVLFAFTIMASIVLIACFNMTSLFLVQATSRVREFAVRLSVGASRWRIVRQMLLESVLLSVTGGFAAIALAYWLQRLGRLGDIELTLGLDLFLVTLVSAIVIGALVSVLPALRAGKTNLNEALKDGGQSSASRHRHRLRNFLIGSQVAMATILTISGVYFTRGFMHIMAMNPPVAPDRIVRVDINVEGRIFTDKKQVSNLARQALDAVEQMPGVERAAVSTVGSLASWFRRHSVSFTDATLNQLDRNHARVINSSPEYLDIHGMKLVDGRPLSDGAMALNEAVVNEEFVRLFLPKKTPALGQEITIDGLEGIRATIVGVVGNRHPKIEVVEDTAEVYISHEHPFMVNYLTATVETKADAAQFGLALRETLQRLHSQQPVGQPVVLADQIDSQLDGLRRTSTMLVGMAAFGLFMALMGVYGVVAYAVVERTREMGIRMAFGATRTRIVRHIMREGTRLLAFGILPGTALIFFLFQGLPNEVLSYIDPSDPWTFAIGATTIFLAGTTASLLPARKMLNLKPNEALRYE